MQPAASTAARQSHLERWFELTSVVPLAGFALLHLGTYGRVLFGTTELGSRHAPSGWALAGEVLGIWLPLAFHAVFGFVVWARRAQRAVEAPNGPWLFLHRLTGLAVGGFLVDHALRFRLPILTGERYPAESVQALARELSTTLNGFPLLAGVHLLGTLALSFHLGFGLRRVAERHTSGNTASWLGRVCVGVGVLWALIGTCTLLRLATG